MSITQPLGGRQISPELQAKAWETFRIHVFQLIQAAWKRLDKAKFYDAEEEAITGELERQIENWMDNPEAPGWVDHYGISEEPRIHHPQRLGKYRRRLDLRFVAHGNRPRLRYEFENKRLCRNKKEVTNYIGTDGLGMFLMGEYAQNWPEAGMLAFIQSDSPDYWAGKVASALIKQEPNCTDCGWQAVALCQDLNTFRSTHQCVSQTSPVLTIYHAFLSLV